MMLRHLIWKDAMAMRPLVSAILIGLLVVFVLAGIFASLFAGTSDRVGIFAAFWVLMPNLVALGAPAVLVGSEEETGTLNWLRTLPVSWTRIADAKYLVAISAVLITWAASSLMMIVARVTVAQPDTPFVRDLESLGGVGYLLFFSALLLNCGFITAYIFRSPVAGLIAVVPVITVINVAAIAAGRWMVSGHVFYPGQVGAVSGSDYAALVSGGIVLLGLTFALQRILACRRLTAPLANRMSEWVDDSHRSAYRPPTIISTTRPGLYYALLWQQGRQIGWAAAALVAVATFFVTVAAIERSQLGTSGLIVAFAPLVVMISAAWLGGLAFYGDNVRRRHAFFADRGVAVTSIWWTRMLLPSLLFVLLLGIVLWAGKGRPGDSNIPIVIVMMFGFGQLVGQWVKRAALTFFAAPAYATIAAIVLVVVFEIYPDYGVAALWTLPVLLFASWRLCGRWLAGRVDYGYHIRAFAYSALALALPIASVVVSRIATTPDTLADWRLTAMSTTISPVVSEVGAVARTGPLDIFSLTFTPTGTSGILENQTPRERLETLRLELEADTIGYQVTLDDLKYVLDDSSSSEFALQRSAMAILLKWSRMIRENVIAGGSGFAVLQQGAEESESVAVGHLSWLASAAGPKADLSSLTGLVASIPDRQLRKDSRRAALLAEWRRYQQTPWERRTSGRAYSGKAFMQFPVAYGVSSLWFERTRADRFVDRLTRLLLRQLDTGLPLENDSAAFRARSVLWDEISGPRYPSPPVHMRLRSWTESYEQQIERLRKVARDQRPETKDQRLETRD